MLCLIKPRGFKDADIFRGTVGGPDTPSSSWEVVVREINFKGIIKSRVYEFSTLEELPDQHAALGSKFRLDFRFDAKIHSKYLKKWTPPLEILEWMDSIITNSEENYEELVKVPLEENSPSDSDISEDPPDLENYFTETSQREPSDTSYANSIAGGSIGIAFCAFLGVVVGTIIADAEEEESDDDGLLLDSHGRRVDFTARNRMYQEKNRRK